MSLHEPDAFAAFVAGLPGTSLVEQWGSRVAKVGGKVFALVGAADLGVSVKCLDRESAALLIDLGLAERAPYLHASWVRIPWGRMDEAELADRLDASYRLIRGKLPRKVQAALG